MCMIPCHERDMFHLILYQIVDMLELLFFRNIVYGWAKLKQLNRDVIQA